MIWQTRPRRAARLTLGLLGSRHFGYVEQRAAINAG